MSFQEITFHWGQYYKKEKPTLQCLQRGLCLLKSPLILSTSRLHPHPLFIGLRRKRRCNGGVFPIPIYQADVDSRYIHSSVVITIRVIEVVVGFTHTKTFG